MSKKDSGNQTSNVVSLQTACTAQACKKKPSVAGFCDEHFVWFKEGLITKDGKRPSDFEKKLVSFMKRTNKAA